MRLRILIIAAACLLLFGAPAFAAGNHGDGHSSHDDMQMDGMDMSNTDMNDMDMSDTDTGSHDMGNMDMSGNDSSSHDMNGMHMDAGAGDGTSHANLTVLGVFAAINAGFIGFGVWNRRFRGKREGASA